MLPVRARIALRLQGILSHLLFPLVGGAIVAILRLRGHRIQGQTLNDVRRRYARLTCDHDGPVIICANHLTMADSALIAWVLASNWYYFWKFKRLPWNLPEWRNFGARPALRVLCYLTKCVPVVRQGSARHRQNVQAKLDYLSGRGESIAIFPEGGRSRSGRLRTETLTYGVGRIAMKAKNPLLVCVYLRGLQQLGTTVLPVFGDRLYVDLCAIQPKTSHPGWRGARDIAIKTMETLVVMERKYFVAPTTRVNHTVTSTTRSAFVTEAE